LDAKGFKIPGIREEKQVNDFFHGRIRNREVIYPNHRPQGRLMMKRRNPFARLTESLTIQTSTLADHPNNFFTEKDEYLFVKKATQALAHISHQYDTPDSPTERLFHDQLDQLRKEMEPAQNEHSESLNPY
jgi:hypothetical protein